jgi:hypothetical protein
MAFREAPLPGCGSEGCADVAWHTGRPAHGQLTDWFRSVSPRIWASRSANCRCSARPGARIIRSARYTPPAPAATRSSIQKRSCLNEVDRGGSRVRDSG